MGDPSGQSALWQTGRALGAGTGAVSQQCEMGAEESVKLRDGSGGGKVRKMQREEVRGLPGGGDSENRRADRLRVLEGSPG